MTDELPVFETELTVAVISGVLALLWFEEEQIKSAKIFLNCSDRSSR